MCFARIQAASLSYCLYFFECLIFWWVSLALQLMIYPDAVLPVLGAIFVIQVQWCCHVLCGFIWLRMMILVSLWGHHSWGCIPCMCISLWLNGFHHLLVSESYILLNRCCIWESFLIIFLIWYTSLLAVASFYADLLYQFRCFHYQLFCGENSVIR